MNWRKMEKKYERDHVKEQFWQQKGQLAPGSKVNTIRVYTFLWVSEYQSLWWIWMAVKGRPTRKIDQWTKATFLLLLFSFLHPLLFPYVQQQMHQATLCISVSEPGHGEDPTGPSRIFHLPGGVIHKSWLSYTSTISRYTISVSNALIFEIICPQRV